jgi:hypothetical protein
MGEANPDICWLVKPAQADTSQMVARPRIRRVCWHRICIDPSRSARIGAASSLEEHE